MVPIRFKIIFLVILFAAPGGKLYSQTVPDSIVRAVSPQFNKPASYTKLWGKHYRAEWTTPVSFKSVLLDTLEGGLVPYAKGGGRQSKNLRLRDKNGREYVLRSLQKTFGGALPKDLRGTFIEELMDDQASISHPFGALIVPHLANAAGIFHTYPRIFFLPQQPALDSFNNEYGNDVYLFEQRPDENWETAANFGNAENIIGTDKLRERLLENSDNVVDQKLYARSRLFDMFIGDWSRHDDQWRWAEFKTKDGRLYKPIPRDRDMAFSLFDGKALKIAIPASGQKQLQSFGSDISKIKYYNFTARHLDLHLTNSLSRDDWQQIAVDLQKRLTDNVINEAVKQLPLEIYPISAATIETSLKSRREHLLKYAEAYYEQLAAYPAITGSEKSELFMVEYLDDTSTRVSVYQLKDGKAGAYPVFQRTFLPNTQEIRIQGIGGEDRYVVSGISKKGIKVRLVGGDEKDHYSDSSRVKKIGKQVKIYDDHQNTFIRGRETSLQLSRYPSVHRFSWNSVRYHKSGIHPIAFYSNADRVFVGLRYSRTKFQWRKEPFGNKQKFDVKYSISQKAPSVTYEGIFTDLLGKFDLDVVANYDWMRWTNFYGLGNESLFETTNRDYYRLRSKELFVSAGLSYRTRNKHRFSILPYFQSITFRKDEERFVSQKGIDENNDFYHTKKYAGANIEYVFQNINDSILPEKGIAWQTSADVFSNTNSGKIASTYSSQLQLLFPIMNKFGLNFRLGGSTLSGTPEFFRNNSIGGSETLRGFQRNRFHGNSTAFIQNELRWISKVRSRWYAGKIGFFGFVDAGRVWLKGENSNTWHLGYGPGLILSPFNKFSIWFAYGISKEDNNLHFRLIRPF